MVIDTLHVLVEEPSMEEALLQLMPKMIRSGVEMHIRRFQCKDDLLKQLPNRLQAYKRFLPATAMLLVIVDRDDDDCLQLKAILEGAAHQAGFLTRQNSAGASFQVINRIAIEELEAWFFGDWAAVCTAYPKLDASVPKRAPYRDPDAIKGGTWEALERELQRKGYFKQGLRKLEVAREVARHMDPLRNQSGSFCCLRDSLATL